MVTLLWGEVSEARARNAFRQTLHRLRSALGDDVVPQTKDMVHIATERVWLDVEEFERAVETGRYEEAVNLYRGELLEGLTMETPAFGQWLDDQRQRFAARFRTALTRLVDEALAHGEAARSIELAQRLSAAAPLDADAAVMEATALVAGGRRAEAIAALTVHTRRVQSELGTRPAAAVSAMLGRLLRHSESRADPTRTGAVVATEAPFVGRARELAQLINAWRGVRDGHGSAVIIAGPRGVGKTRLVDEFLERAQSLGPTLLLRGRESSQVMSVSYASIAEALRGVADAPGIAGASQHLLAEAARLLPQLRDRFNLPEPGPIADDAERLRFYEGIAALIDAIAYEQPVILVLEDVDRATQPTISLVHYLVRRLGAVPVLFVLTSSAAANVGLEDADRVELGPLSLDESLALIDAVLGDEHPSPEERRRVAILSDGLPYRVLELAERMVAAGVPTAAPTTLRDVMSQRLHRCTPYEQRVFVAASLLGRPAHIHLLAAAAHLSETAALDAVLELERKGLVVQRREGVEPANATVAELALESTGAAGVSLLAGWAADALHEAQAARPAELAALYSLAGRTRDVYPHAREAAWAASAAGAIDDATRFVDLAVQHARTPEERDEAATLLRSIGIGPALLGGGAAEPVVEDEIPAGAAAGTTPEPTASARRRTRRRWTVRPQIIGLGIAAIGAAGAVRYSMSDRTNVRGSVLTDTLVVAERVGAGDVRHYFVAGPLLPEPVLTRGSPLRLTVPWADSLALPWANPIPSPTGRAVAVERVSSVGSDLYVITADRRDTVPLSTAQGDDIGVGWSPDGQWVLALRGSANSSGEYDTDLVAYHVPSRTTRRFESDPGISVVEASWSPRGPHVAWVARVGGERQQDIFVSRADGSGRRNLSANPAEDYHVTWSPDGEVVAFTSERDGNAEIYTAEINTGVVRRMTVDAAPDDRASFSPDGQFLAFESTRGGTLSVYLMPSFAGAARRIATADRRLSLVQWRGSGSGYVDRVRVRAPLFVPVGGRAVVSAEALDAAGNEVPAHGLEWITPDTALLGVADTIAGDATRLWVIGRRAGTARLAANLAGWRADTVRVQAGAVAQDFVDPFNDLDHARWSTAGVQPVVARGVGRAGSSALMFGAGSGQSTLRSQRPVLVGPGTRLTAWIRAPISGSTSRAMLSVGFAIDEPTQEGGGGVSLAAIEWHGDARRVAYVVDRESVTEPVTRLGASAVHTVAIMFERDGRVAFYVDGRLRRRSAVRALSGSRPEPARLRISGRGDGIELAVDDVALHNPNTASRGENSR